MDLALCQITAEYTINHARHVNLAELKKYKNYYWNFPHDNLLIWYELNQWDIYGLTTHLICYYIYIYIYPLCNNIIGI